MDYFWKRLSPEGRRKVHERYLGDFPTVSLEEGFERYEEMLRLVERERLSLFPLARKIVKEHDVYLCYIADRYMPQMTLRAWVPGIEFSFRQGEMKSTEKQALLLELLSSKHIDMHCFTTAKYDKNSLPSLESHAQHLIANALNRVCDL